MLCFEYPNWAILATNDPNFATEYPNWAIFITDDPNFATEYILIN